MKNGYVFLKLTVTGMVTDNKCIIHFDY